MPNLFKNYYVRLVVTAGFLMMVFLTTGAPKHYRIMP